MIGIANAIGFKGFSWSSYWATRLLFESDTIDFDNSLLLDKSGNDNDIALGGYPCYKANSAGGFYHNSAGYVSGWTFTQYGEFIYNGAATGPIWAVANEALGGNLVYLHVPAGKLAFLERVSNITYTGNTVLTSGQRYKFLIVATTKDIVNIYLDGSTSPEISMIDKNFVWDAATYKIGVGVCKRNTPIYSTSAKIFNFKLAKASVKTWTTIHTECDNWWPLTDKQGIRQHDVVGTAHLLAVGTVSATNVSTQDYFGYHQKYGYTIYYKEGYPLLQVPMKSDGTRLTATVTGYAVVRDVAGSSLGLNMCQCTIKIPYSAAMAAVDTVLSGLFFTGVTPNAIDVNDIWTDQAEENIMFANLTYAQMLYGSDIVGISELLIFDEAQITSSTNALYNRIGYSTTPALEFDGSLVDISGNGNNAASYTLVTENDGLIMPVKTDLMNYCLLSGIYGYFYNSTFGNAVPIRLSDLPCVMGRSFFCDRAGKMRVYKKDLLPSHMAIAINEMFGITGVDFYITTKNGINHQNIDFEKYTLVSGALNLNPSASAETKYDVFDRRNVVGAAKEIWDATLVLGSDYWTWNVNTGTYKLNQGTVYKFIQAAYKDRIFWNQEFSTQNAIILREIVVFSEALTGDAKTAMYTHIDFPETFDEPTIDGGGVVDDATAINASIAANANVLLYQQDAIVLTSVLMKDNVRLTLIDSTITATDDIEANTLRNIDYDLGNENIEVCGYGTSIIDGNAANQVRDEVTYFDADFYKFMNIMFCNVSGSLIKGITVKDPAAFNVFHQLCTYPEVRNIIIDSDVSQVNQDGLSFSYGTQYGVTMFITGNSGDDSFPILAGDADHHHGYQAAGTGETKNFFYRNLYAYPVGDGHIIRWHRSKSQVIENAQYWNINNSGFKSLFICGYWGVPVDTGSGGHGSGLLLRNFIGGSTGSVAFWFISNAWNDMDFDNMIFNFASNTHIYLQNAESGLSLTDVSIKSILNIAPTVAILNDAGATIVNFTHEETINY